ncbi:MAG: hypothetical protein EA397_13135 [Deltaproteobacteria bacterium]|nr:MAG: hypothetical protein EA397_13135 [Deltaproteobacteria bacterium]
MLFLAGCLVSDAALDRDGDGFIAIEAGGDDCDDNDPNVYPGAPEDCSNGVDDNCSGYVDRVHADPADDGERVLTPTVGVPQPQPVEGGNYVFLDEDGDDYGVTGERVWECRQHQSTLVGSRTYVPRPDDCDDTNPQINPGIIDDQCNGVDNNCDGTPDSDANPQTFWFPDRDRDGWGDRSDPGQSRQMACPHHASEAGHAWSRRLQHDCDDTDPTVYPGAPEVCDGRDNSCSGIIDDGVLGDGPECPAESCMHFHDMRPEVDTAQAWILDPQGGENRLTCVDRGTLGRGWWHLDMDWIYGDGVDRVALLNIEGDGIARWGSRMDEQYFRLEPKVQTSGSGHGRRVGVHLELPVEVHEIDGRWRLRATAPVTGRHWGADLPLPSDAPLSFHPESHWPECNHGGLTFVAGSRLYNGVAYLKERGFGADGSQVGRWGQTESGELRTYTFQFIDPVSIEIDDLYYRDPVSWPPELRRQPHELRWFINDCAFRDGPDPNSSTSDPLPADTGGELFDISLYLR